MMITQKLYYCLSGRYNAHYTYKQITMSMILSLKGFLFYDFSLLNLMSLAHYPKTQQTIPILAHCTIVSSVWSIDTSGFTLEPDAFVLKFRETIKLKNMKLMLKSWSCTGNIHKLNKLTDARHLRFLPVYSFLPRRSEI